MPLLHFWEDPCGVCRDVPGTNKLVCIVAPPGAPSYNIKFWLCNGCISVARSRGMGGMAYARDPDTHVRLLKQGVPRYIATPKFDDDETPLTSQGIDGLVEQARAQGFYMNKGSFALYSQLPEPRSGPLTVLRTEDKKILARAYGCEVFRHGEVSKGKEFGFSGEMRFIADTEEEEGGCRIYFTCK